ncbi:myotubularin-related protein 12-like, partial [Scleropages formosus]
MGEVIFCSASPIRKCTQDDFSQRGIFGSLFCTNFRISFISDETQLEEEESQVFKNKLYGENDIPLTCVDNIYGGFDEKKKLITSGSVRNKYPSKIIIHCKDLRIFQGIVHHCLEPKSLKCIFAFSYKNQTKLKTVMFDSMVDWAQEMKRTKGNCKLVSANADFNISTNRMLNAVAQNHLYSVKTEELPETLPTIQDIQQSYNKFKQFFLVEEEGSDLCCVISSLVQVMLDPHFRTLEGFQSLVQKEWVAGGHHFLDRCNYLHKDKELQSPVFLLFLECVWQLLQQYAPAFQFSETYLTVLSDSVDVSVFSTFLFNSPHHRATTIQPVSLLAQKGPLNLPTVWDWSVQFNSAAQDFFTNPLYVEKSRQDKVPRKTFRPKHQRHQSLPSTAFKSSPKKSFFKDETDSLKKMLRVKRISRWLNPTDLTQSTTREFYEAWQRKPLDYHGLLLPCVDGPALRVWAQRYLRWLPEVQIFGGGAMTLEKKLVDLLAEVRELRGKLDWHCSVDFSHRGAAALAGSSVRLSSAFPFFVSRTWSFKPAIPSCLQKNLITGTFADKEDEDSECLG